MNHENQVVFQIRNELLKLENMHRYNANNSKNPTVQINKQNQALLILNMVVHNWEDLKNRENFPKVVRDKMEELANDSRNDDYFRQQVVEYHRQIFPNEKMIDKTYNPFDMTELYFILKDSKIVDDFDILKEKLRRIPHFTSDIESKEYIMEVIDLIIKNHARLSHNQYFLVTLDRKLKEYTKSPVSEEDMIKIDQCYEMFFKDHPFFQANIGNLRAPTPVKSSYNLRPRSNRRF